MHPLLALYWVVNGVSNEHRGNKIIIIIRQQNYLQSNNEVNISIKLHDCGHNMNVGSFSLCTAWV